LFLTNLFKIIISNKFIEFFFVLFAKIIYIRLVEFIYMISYNRH